MNPYNYFPWCYLRNCVYHTSPHSVQELQAEIEAVAEDITGGILCDTVDNVVVCLQQVYEVKVSHTEHVIT
jgi:hypothetical protein